MNIVIATDLFSPWTGGPATFIENLCASLAHSAHTVHIIAPSATGRPERSTSRSAIVHRVPTVPFPFGDHLRVSYRMDAVRHVLLGAHADVLQVHHPFPLSFAAVQAARTAGIPTVAINHTIPECFFYGLRGMPALYKPATAVFWRYLRSFLGTADAVCTPTQTAAALLRRAGFQQQIQVISNGIDVDRFLPAANKAEVRASLSLPDKPLVLYIGRLDPEKDMTTWLHAASLLRAQLDCHFVIGGTGTERKKLAQVAEMLQLGTHCTFLDYVAPELLPSYYSAADLYCITGAVELQSISTLEAMACGLPVVAANAAALPELVRAGSNGFLAMPGDAQSFAEAMRWVLEDPVQATTMGRQSRLVAESHAMPSVALQHINLLEQVAHHEQQAAGNRSA